MSIDVAIQFATRKPDVPRAADIRRWITAVLKERDHADAQLTVRIVNEAEGRELNNRWRGKAEPTNVLSFPCEGLTEVAPALLGDIVICAPVVAREAAEQDKPVTGHWAHMLIHGTLHLLGHDHQSDAEAAMMEKLETDILQNFGYADPYRTK